MACRPRRHSVVTLRLTAASDDVFSDEYRRDPSMSPTLCGRPRLPPRTRQRPGGSALCRTPTSPLCRSPTSPMARSPPPLHARTPTSPRARTPTSPCPQTPSSPHSPALPLRRDSQQSPIPGRTTPSPVSPRSNRVFRYDYATDQRNLRRRSSLLTVPSAHETMPDYFYRSPRKRSSSIAGPLRPPPDLLRYLNETAAIERALGAASSSSSSNNSLNDRGGPSSRSPIPRSLPISPDHSASAVAANQRRRHSNATDSTSGLCRLRQFSTTSHGRVVNRGDSLRPRLSASNTSVNSIASTTSRDLLPSTDSNCTPTPLNSRSHSPPSSRIPTPATTPLPTPKYYVGMVGAPGVGRNSLVTQFMTSEYMCAYDDSSDESGSERSVSVVLDGEEAELIFVRVTESKQAKSASTSSEGCDPLQSAIGDADKDIIDAWVVIYSVSDRKSFREATAALGRIWAKGCVADQAVILVGNKTDLERTRIVSTTEGRKLAKTYECKFIEVSAGFAHHVDELLVGILVQIRLKHRNKSDGAKMSRGSIRRLKEKLKDKNSFKVKGLIGKMLCRSRITKSCENLHML